MTALTISEQAEDLEWWVTWLDQMYCGLRDGSVPWQDWASEPPSWLTESGKQEWAASEAGSALDCARAELDALTGGTR